MNSNPHSLAASRLWQLWRSGGQTASLQDPPSDRAAGYAVQARFAANSTASPSGWKIAATSVAGQRHIGVGGPMLGRLLGEGLYPAGGTLPIAGNHMRVAEAEFAFRFRDPLPARAQPYSASEVFAAVASLHPALEIPDSRFEDFAQAGEACLIADNACAHQFVLGPASPDIWRNLDLASHAVHARAGATRHEGIGRNVLGDPRAALVWAVNELSGLGYGITAWEVVTTGTCVVPMPIAHGERVEADFGPLGTVSCRFGL